MKKIVFIMVFIFQVVYAELIDGVALVVNGQAITLFEINQKISKEKKSKEDAISSLIDDLLYQQQLQEHGIDVDIFDVNRYIEKVARSNNMDLYQFKSIIRQQYPDFKAYENTIRKNILREKLLSKLLRGKLREPKEEDLRIYYNNNLSRFSYASQYEVVQYISRNKKELFAISKNPLSRFPDVQKNERTLETQNLNPKMRYLLNDTPVRGFTPIFTANGNFVMLYVKKKENYETASFDSVRSKIFQLVIVENEKRYLQDFFEKLRLNAKITRIR